MPTHYVEDYDGKRNADAVERPAFEPVSEVDSEVTAKVVGAPQDKKPKRSTTARTKTGDH